MDVETIGVLHEELEAWKTTISGQLIEWKPGSLSLVNLRKTVDFKTFTLSLCKVLFHGHLRSRYIASLKLFTNIVETRSPPMLRISDEYIL